MRVKWLCLAFIGLMLISGTSAKNQIIESNDFQKLIENGSREIILDQYYIKGPLNFYQNGGQLDKKITIKNSIFEGDVFSSQVIFLEDVSFENTSFYQEALFSSAAFLRNASFKETRFEKKASFSNVEFKGSADFSNSRFKTSDFSNSDFKKNADFSRAEFNYTSNFNGANFTNASFESARFLGTAPFINASFNGSTLFSYSKFYGLVFFMGAEFLNDLFAEQSHFYGDSDFQRASFNGSTNFMDTYFYGACKFDLSKFNGSANFQRVFFLSPASFYRVEFRNKAGFFNTTYYNSANFGFAKFFGGADFHKSIFKDEAAFGRSEFQGDANFEETIFKDADFLRSKFMGNANFYDSKFNEAFFEESKIKNLNLNKAKYDKMYIRIQDVDKLAFDEATYKSLIDNFKKIGFFEDANNCYYRFMVEYGDEKLGLNQIPKLKNKINIMQINANEVSTDSLDNLFLSIYYLFSWILYGFGTKPLYTLIWSLILMIFVFGPFWWHVQRKSSEKKGDEYNWDNYDHKTALKSDISYKFHEIIKAVMLSSSIFLSGTKFFIDPPDIPEALEKVTPWVSRVFKLERFFGGILSILFLISIGSVIFSI
jgi:uncharacterized protein YjbI with pentapeptide repeats